MIQGTGSSVGKSIITAALCRVFKEDGYKTAPFKSQNMALNSYVTKNGEEMGRAQVVQAEAAGIDPMVEMNPILLKPTSEVGSQVILMGRVHKNLTASEYRKEVPNIKGIVDKAYKKLSNDFDVIVIEGAGSPAEINLRENDLVNMGLAELVDSPVVLVGDIERGGVFASLYGTVMILEPSERARIKGFIINKFRGDIEILKPGIKMLEDKINIPCLGVLPYFDLKIDDEDSVTSKFTNNKNNDINIGVVKLPYVSNFSDFTPLEMEDRVSVKYITEEEGFENIDLLIIPGSKNTIKDMEFIIKSRLDRIIYKKHKEGIPIIGICGGYQMLGYEILDPKGIESSMKQINGLGLMKTQTIIQEVKDTKQVKGIIANNPINNLEIETEIINGYEIHMGQTKRFDKCKPFIELEDGRFDGAVSETGLVFGTYLHGIFENDNFRTKLIKLLIAKKGLNIDSKSLNFKELKDIEYQKLSETVRKYLNIEEIKKISGLYR
ncbi:cobyric acid synthase [Clostridium sp. D2Q-11]|uniref:Cobyric acid synthase n=1 Tax=Anaeromonas frigoriresistens TaxID=2683708 RepID=A0A942USS7_9FIRM|nr:cobyric acid synthase [Anaeromonas frigoriresistens]MBS4538559.1 cobyric acid synthase [Anaeromonas frigoriresistens]